MVIGGLIMVGTAFLKRIAKFVPVSMPISKEKKGETIQRRKLFKGGN